MPLPSRLPRSISFSGACDPPPPRCVFVQGVSSGACARAARSSSCARGPSTGTWRITSAAKGTFQVRVYVVNGIIPTDGHQNDIKLLSLHASSRGEIFRANGAPCTNHCLVLEWWAARRMIINKESTARNEFSLRDVSLFDIVKACFKSKLWRFGLWDGVKLYFQQRWISATRQRLVFRACAASVLRSRRPCLSLLGRA